MISENCWDIRKFKPWTFGSLLVYLSVGFLLIFGRRCVDRFLYQILFWCNCVVAVMALMHFQLPTMTKTSKQPWWHWDRWRHYVTQFVTDLCLVGKATMMWIFCLNVGEECVFLVMLYEVICCMKRKMREYYMENVIWNVRCHPNSLDNKGSWRILKDFYCNNA